MKTPVGQVIFGFVVYLVGTVKRRVDKTSFLVVWIGSELLVDRVGLWNGTGFFLVWVRQAVDFWIMMCGNWGCLVKVEIQGKYSWFWWLRVGRGDSFYSSKFSSVFGTTDFFFFWNFCCCGVPKKNYLIVVWKLLLKIWWCYLVVGCFEACLKEKNSRVKMTWGICRAYV